MAESNPIPPQTEQQPDATHDGAPAGPWFTDAELPSVAVLGGPPMTLNGYSPDPSPTPQIDKDPTMPPTGLRR